ncbi:MAG: fused MFS/spermidine synthase [Acidobacteriota bacterium]
MLTLYSMTLFLSAALMFMVQPMFGKMVLPLLGGSPAVWNTEVAFCQAALLLGYLYAHVTSHWLGIRRQAVLHCFVVFVPLLLLPIEIPQGQAPPTVGSPVPWLLGLLSVALGLPFFMVATIAPMLQKWFSNTDHPRSEDPYFLYAASNAGSLIGLLGYPILVEPYFELKTQGWVWGVGYGVLIALTLACAVKALQSNRSPAERNSSDQNPGAAPENRGDPLNPRQRLRWILGAFVPSSLMLSVTTYLSVNIAPVPLLWVIPLSIYLVTFILVFARRKILPHGGMVRIFSAAILPLIIVIIFQATQPIWLMMGIHLVGFFVIAMVCHGDVAKYRPRPIHLTEYYLWISFGGVLGGLFNAIVAPAIFPTLTEYPLVLVLSVLLLAWNRGELQRPYAWQDLVLPGSLGVITGGFVYLFEILDMAAGPLAQVVMFGIPAGVCYGFSRRPLRFGLSLGALFLASSLYSGGQGTILHTERDFFGIHKVLLDRQGSYHLLSHSGTLHGRQSLERSRRCEPLSYYHASGPLGQVFSALHNRATQWRIAAIGLGTGSTASYQQSGQQWTFFELDPTVVEIASNSNYFTFLSDCAQSVKVILGDARLSLSREKDNQYDLIILDAYSSDSIPIHLMTREALQLYRDKLTDDGLLVFHLSNQYLDLASVAATLAQDAGMAYRFQDDGDLSRDERSLGKDSSRWAIMAHHAESFGRLAQDPRWQEVGRTEGRVWTDNHSSIFSVLDWTGRGF